MGLFDRWGSVLSVVGMTNNNIKKHRLSGGFDPRAYRFVESFDNRTSSVFDGDAINPLPGELADEVKLNGYSLDHCTHCGAALLSGAVYQHDSGEHIIIGTTCSGRLDFESAGEIQAAHKANRIYIAGLRKAIRKSEKPLVTMSQWAIGSVASRRICFANYPSMEA